MGGAHSPPRRGGWRDSLIEAGAPGAKREPDRAKPQLMFGETLRRSDHPGCAASVASRHSFDGAATPPLRGGEWAPPIRHRNYETRGGAMSRRRKQAVLAFVVVFAAAQLVRPDRETPATD